MTTSGLLPIAETWRRGLGPAPRHLAVSILALFGLLAGLLARQGTTAARVGALGGLLALLCVLGVLRWRDARIWKSKSRTLRRVLAPVNPSLGARALRTLALVEKGERGSLHGSAELARWQFDRLLSEATEAAVSGAAARVSRRLVRSAAFVSLVALGILVAAPARLAEGWDVLMARKGRAPISLTWLDALHLTAQAPAYLHLSAETLLPGDEVSLPVGTVVTVNGVPVREGRQLVLTDGKQELPFESDGRGGVVARYSVEGQGSLRVAARFGGVLIEQAEPVTITPEVDQPPRIELKGAPGKVRLAELERLELVYEVTDDHGIKQVDLVLRAGVREERRVLARKDGEITQDRGGQVLSIRDPFFRRTSLPVTISIEAKDNDATSGPKWGHSAALVAIPPALGEPEAARLADLSKARDVFVDLLGWQLEGARAASEHRTRALAAAKFLTQSLEHVHAGLGMPAGLKAFLRAQAEAVEALPRAGKSWTGRTEGVVLAVDAVLHGLGQRDARATARRLGDLAEEAAHGAKIARETERQRLGLDRMESALVALKAGCQQLLRLGELGRDLGSVAQADLARVDRALSHDDLWHGELAARHLAARLRRADPSFAVAWRPGVEAGGSASWENGRASQADQEFDRLMRELAALALEHGSHLESLRATLDESRNAMVDETLRQEAASRASGLRHAASRLPRAFEDSSTASGAAGIARQQVEAMADELERLALSPALENGSMALFSLKEAQRRRPDLDSDLDPEALGEIRQRVGQDVAWAQERLAELGRKAEARARPSLGEAGERERQFGRRAGHLVEGGKQGESALPREFVDNLERAEDLMQDAARALDQARAERGVELGRAAQTLLEELGTGRTSDAEDAQPSDTMRDQSARGVGVATGGQVPGVSADTAEGFRRRVLDGLGHSGSGRLGAAVKRYAEGLLR